MLRPRAPFVLFSSSSSIQRRPENGRKCGFLNNPSSPHVPGIHRQPPLGDGFSVSRRRFPWAPTRKCLPRSFARKERRREKRWRPDKIRLKCRRPRFARRRPNRKRPSRRWRMNGLAASNSRGKRPRRSRSCAGCSTSPTLLFAARPSQISLHPNCWRSSAQMRCASGRRRQAASAAPSVRSAVT